MLRDVYWRQYPIDLLSDDKMACVEAMLPDEQKHIPYMIYIAALKLCDDNGVFDLDDGVVMARLTRVKDVRVIFDVVNLMRQRKILFRLFDKSTLCGLVDWTYSDKKPRTIEERRRLVAERIQKEQARAGVDKDFTMPGEEPAAPEFTAPVAVKPFPVPDNIKKCKICDAYDAATKCCTDNRPNACREHLQPRQEAETAPAPQDFLCPKNDKKPENVVISEMDDKKPENVVTLQNNTVQDNKTEQTNIQDIQTDTHTQQQVPSFGRVIGPTLETCEDTDAVGVKKNTKNQNINTDGDASGADDISTLAEQALSETQGIDEEKDTGGLVAYLNDFFVKNCYGFKKNQSAGAIKKLVSEIMQLSDEVNPPETVASVLCSEFKKLCEGQREAYWKGTPLLPAYMIKPRILAEIIQNAGKILATAQNEKKFAEAAKKAEEECKAEADIVSVAMREEYLKYNIDPDDPNAATKIIVAKAQEHEAMRKAEDEEFEIF